MFVNMSLFFLFEWKLSKSYLKFFLVDFVVHNESRIFVKGQLDFVVDEEIYFLLIFTYKLNGVFIDYEVIFFPYIRLILLISVPLFEVIWALQPAFGKLPENRLERVIFIWLERIFPIIHVFYCVFYGVSHLVVRLRCQS